MDRFPEWGYTIVSMEMQQATIAAMLKEARKAPYEAIFREVGSAENDPFRTQARVKNLSATMKLVDKHIRAVVKTYDPLYNPSGYTFLFSRAGGGEQDPHQDFSEADRKQVHDQHPNSVPASIIVALEPGTTVKVFAYCFDTARDDQARVVEIPVGFGLVFRGDLVHCGAAFTRPNYRLHAYLTFPRVAWTPGVVTSVTSVLVCQFCGHQSPSSSKIRNNRFYCEYNPEGPAHREKRRVK